MTTSEQENSNTAEQSKGSSQNGGRGFFYNLCENVDNAVKGATEKASAKASEAAPKVKRIIERGAYQVSYTAAYGVVFGGLVAKQFLKDNVILEGVKDGVEAGRTAADKRSTSEPATTEGVPNDAGDQSENGFTGATTPSPA